MGYPTREQLADVMFGYSSEEQKRDYSARREANLAHKESERETASSMSARHGGMSMEDMGIKTSRVDIESEPEAASTYEPLFKARPDTAGAQFDRNR